MAAFNDRSIELRVYVYSDKPVSVDIETACKGGDYQIKVIGNEPFNIETYHNCIPTGHDRFAVKTRYEVQNRRYFASIFCELPRGAPERNGNAEP